MDRLRYQHGQKIRALEFAWQDTEGVKKLELMRLG